MLNKKVLESCIISLEDIKGLYSELEQTAADPIQKQRLQTIQTETEQQFLYLNNLMNSLRS